VQQGADPEIDTAKIILQADALGRGEHVASEAVEASIDTVDHASQGPGEDYSTDDIPERGTERESSLLDIFGTECLEHLRAIEEYIRDTAGSSVVSEALYRALHTLSGISESAEVVSIRELAGNLNDYFDEYYHANQPVSRDAIDVLQACYTEISNAVQRLPDITFDEANQRLLLDQIASLPRIDTQQAMDDGVSTSAESSRPGMDDAEVEAVAVIDEKPAAEPDPFSDMDQELYEIFIEEASEIIDSSEAVLRAWSEQPGNSEYMAEFQRQLHTIKGGARMVDIQAIGDLSHVLESLMTRIADGLLATSNELFTLIQESHDRLSDMLEQVKVRQLPAVATHLEKRLTALWQTEDAKDECDKREEVTESPCVEACETHVEAAEAVSQEDMQVEAPVSVQDRDVEPVDTGRDVTALPPEQVQDKQAEVDLPMRTHLAFPQKREHKKQVHAHSEQVRVQSTLLDEMVNYAGEINIYRSRMEQQVSDYRYNLAELDQTITRLRDQLRQLEMEVEAQILYRHEQEVDATNMEFDPLELDRYSNLQQSSRSLIESISDLRSLQELMKNTTRESETLLMQQSRVSTDLQEGLLRSRMIPFAGLASRLRRIVRQSARQLGKKVDLELLGAEGEMDRTVIERVIAPLEHMLRNAVAHGIELPDQRTAAGKQVDGLITISFEREGPEIVLRIEDDGAGINAEAVRLRAIERDLMEEDSQLSDYDVMQFILQTGFSTAAEVTQISGRGVGLDVVNSEVKQLGGSLHIESTAGQGTRFTVRLPYTLAINQVLVVMAGSETFCVPLASVEGVVRANCEELTECYRSDECLYNYAGNEYQLKHLGTLLNTAAVAPVGSQKQAPVLLVRIGEKRIAIQIEALLGSREIVIKPVGTQLSKLDCISGATILGDGRVVMILDMAAIARMNSRARMPEVPAVSDNDSRLVIMVVDDSITVRKVTTRLLERNGFRVLTAKDGVDAMGQLQEAVPDMMLLDIEMPRMDGFELATHMRNDTRLKHIPIIMITSRTGDKHRERAQQIGVSNYLGKPYQESDLLDSIYRIIGVSAAGAIA
jgi:chemosensory pili system protein ChpA (sensor histidine kinase/response regulator)